MLAAMDEARTPAFPRDEAMRLAETAYARFAEAVEGLTPEDWSRPTDCTGWKVRDLVGHVVGSMRAAASTREFVSQFREIKRRAKQRGGNETDHMTAIQIERTADATERAITRECRDLVGPAARGRRRTPALLRRRVTIPVEFGDVSETWTLGYLVDVVLTRDAWLHRIDLCRAVDKEPVLTPDHDGRIVADVALEWAERHRSPVHLTLTGPAGGDFEWGEGGERLEFDAVEFCRILSGRAPGEGLLATAVPF